MIGIMASCQDQADKISDLAQTYQLIPCSSQNEHPLVIELSANDIILHWNDKNSISIAINFDQGDLKHRRQTPRSKDLLYKALGLKHLKQPSIIDATAGWGEDSLLMSHWGCEVTMIEQCPWLFCILEEALKRCSPSLKKNIITLWHGDALQYISKHSKQADIIYLDPMFSLSKKKSQVKKNMQILRTFIQSPEPNVAEKLLDLARAHAKHKVVMKRHKNTPPLNASAVSHSVTGKSTCYDIYLTSNH